MDVLPGPLRLSSSLPFVGRVAELGRLRPLLTTGGIVLLGGEPGSGKSRLARELAAEATKEGVLVLYGSCDAVVRTPYRPFVEALEQAARTLAPDELKAALGPSGGELTRLLPDLPARVGELPPPVKADPDTERHRLHTTVAGLLGAIGTKRPVLLVLEDGHWADAPTLLLLRHLARVAPDARLLLLATFRDTEADVPDSLAEALADLRRSESVVRMRLGGLSSDALAEFVQRAAGAGSPELAQSIGELTGGNAFLVCELWRALVETGGLEVAGGAVRLTRPIAGTPESVREVVSQRLARLSPATADVLELAATAGAEFDLAMLRRAGVANDAQLLYSVDEAVRSGMLDELPSRALAYRFTHELVRRALYDRLSAVRRAELHLRVGEALEPEGARAVADLAHHFAAAAPLAGAERGIHYNALAARAASAALAYDQAVARLRTALELRVEDAATRAELLFELGTAAHRAGKVPDAKQAFRDAAAIARELRDGALLARAAIGYEDSGWRPGMIEEDTVALCEEALPGAPPELRPALLSGLARALDFRREHARAEPFRAEAIELARREGDRAALAVTLTRAYWSRGDGRRVLAQLTEAMRLGEQLGDTEILAEAISWRVPTFVGLGNLAAARREIEALLDMAERTGQPFMLHIATHYGAAIALSDGRLEQADALAQSSAEWSRVLSGRDASGVHGIQMFGIRREQGRLAELAPLIRLLAARGGVWRPGLAVVLAELGMQDEARTELTRVRRDGLDSLRDLWQASLVYLTDAAAALGDAALAELLYPELEPLAGSIVMIGHLVACYGSADRYLGMLDATLGRREQAEARFTSAAEHDRRTGMRTWLAHTLYEHARARRAWDEDATALLADAEDASQGLPALRTRLLALRAPGELPDGLSSREAQILGLVARGLSNREIGAALTISEHTAANHIRSILRKTACANRTQAASYAHRHGLAGA